MFTSAVSISPEKALSQQSSSSKVTVLPHPNLLSFPLLAAKKVINATSEKDALSLKNEEKKIYIPKELQGLASITQQDAGHPQGCIFNTINQSRNICLR